MVNSPPAPKRARLDWVDALRGIAALAVALFHGMLVLWIGVTAVRSHAASSFDRLTSYLSWPAHYGYVGVMLFFVLSGFVIHLPYAAGRRPFAFGSYFVRRFLRIYPPYAAALLLSVVVATHVHVHRLLDTGGGTIVKSIFFLQNYPHGRGLFAELANLQAAGNIALWSLPVEFELYLAYPVVLLLVHRFALKNVMLWVAGVSVAATLVDIYVARPADQASNWGNYVPTFMHYWIVWCAGMWLAEVLARKQMPAWNLGWSIALWASVLANIVDRLPLIPYDFRDYVLMVSFVCVMVWISSRSDIAGRFTATNPVVRLGDMSYSLYLVHMPIFITLLAIWTHFRSGVPTNYLVSVVAVIIAIPISYGFSLLFESPSIALGKRLGRLLDARGARGAAVPAAKSSL